MATLSGNILPFISKMVYLIPHIIISCMFHYQKVPEFNHLILLMANVARKVNFRFTPFGFIVEYVSSRTPEHANTHAASRHEVTQATVGVISVSP